MVKPYLPDIIQGVVDRVNASFTSRDEDPFEVFFEKGLLMQVRRSVYKAEERFPLVWFVMKYAEDFKRRPGVYAVANFQLILAMPTDNTYTQQQREDISYKPRLLPIYEMLTYEMSREKWFSYNGEHGPDHTRVIEPYWAMGDVNGQDTDNLFKGNKIDAISLYYKDVAIVELDCAPSGGYDVANPNLYPVATTPLTFFDDIELIVGQTLTDPLPGSNSIVIPFLIGKEYEVQQRIIGQLRKRRDVEFIPDQTNGGFALTGGLTFNQGDTYIIKIRPAYII